MAPDMASAIWAINANNCFGMFVFGICAGFGWSLVNIPFTYWRR